MENSKIKEKVKREILLHQGVKGSIWPCFLINVFSCSDQAGKPVM